MDFSDYNSEASSDCEVEQLLRDADDKSGCGGVREKVIQVNSVSPKCAAVSKEAMEAAEAGVNILNDVADKLGGAAVFCGTVGIPASASRRCVSCTLTEARRWMSLCQPVVALKNLTAIFKISKLLRNCHEAPGVVDTIPSSDESLSRMTNTALSEVRTHVLSDYRETIKKGIEAGVVTREHHIQLRELEAQQVHEEGVKQKEAGNAVAALSCFYKVLNIRKAIQGEHHPHTAVARSFIATCLRDSGDCEASLSELRAAITTQRIVFPPNHPHIAVTQNNIGAILRQLGRPEEALAEHSQAFQNLVSFYNTQNHPFASEVQEHIGHTFKLMGDRNAATVAYQCSYDIRIKVLGANHPKTQKLLERLATLPSTWAAPRSMKVVKGEQNVHSGREWICSTCSVSNLKGATACRCGYQKPLCKSGIEQIFDGCVFAFSGMIPKSLHPSRWKEWKFAEQCGARIQEEVTECVTHVIFKEGYEKSEKVKRAQSMGIAVVPADWFYYGVEWGFRFPDNAFSSRISDKSARTRRSHSCPGKRHLLLEPKRSSSNILPPPKPLVAVPPAGSPKKRITPRDDSPDGFTQSSRSPVHTPVPLRPETPLVVNLETPRVVTVEESTSITPRSSTWGCSSAFSAINSIPRTGSFNSNGGSSACEILSVGSNNHSQATVRKMSTPWGNRKVVISSNLAPMSNNTAADEATAGDLLWNAASQSGLSPCCSASRVSLGGPNSGVYSGRNVIASQIRKNLMKKAYSQQKGVSLQQSPTPKAAVVSSATNIKIELAE